MNGYSLARLFATPTNSLTPRGAIFTHHRFVYTPLADRSLSQETALRRSSKAPVLSLRYRPRESTESACSSRSVWGWCS